MTTEQTFPVLPCYEIINATGGILISGKMESMFHGVSTDSRHICPGNLFIPLKGGKFDGHDYIFDAERSGAAGFLVQKASAEKIKQSFEYATIIGVEDTLTALGDIAHFWRKKNKATVIAITGSSGKTTTKEMTAAVVGLKKKVLKAQGNFNNLIGLPLTLLQTHNEHEVTILEMGTNTPGEIGKLTRIAKPDIGLITNIGPAHLEGLKSVDMVREEKCDLFRNMSGSGIAVINMDDEKLRISEKEWRGRAVTFGFSKNADVSADEIKSNGIRGVRFSLTIENFKQEITMSTVGNHNIANALAAAASSWGLGIDFPTICQGLTAFQPVSGRMQISRLKNGALIINDTYNANPASFREALKTLKDLKGDHRSIVVMGDMLELGDGAKEMHEGIGSLMADTEVGTMFLRGRLSPATAAGALKRNMPEDRIIFFEAPDEVITRLTSFVKEDDWILVKGSRQTKMEDVVQKIIEVFGVDEGQAKGMRGIVP